MKKEHYSKKYEKWLLLDDTKLYQGTKSLYRFNDAFYYDKRRDTFIHASNINDYVENTYKIRKKIAQLSAIEKAELKKIKNL